MRGEHGARSAVDVESDGGAGNDSRPNPSSGGAAAGAPVTSRLGGEPGSATVSSPGPPRRARARRHAGRSFPWGRAAVWLLCLLPAGALAAELFTGRLIEPVDQITDRTGWWALTLLLVTLAVTPLRRLTGWNRLIGYRRLLGLFAFFYACLHVLTYFVLDQFFAWSFIVEDIVERPYITVGFTAWLLLIPLAVTSTRGWIRRLGPRWRKLHRLVYLSAALAIVHFLWQVKADTREPLIFAGALAVLLLLRLPAVSERLRS